MQLFKPFDGRNSTTYIVRTLGNPPNIPGSKAPNEDWRKALDKTADAERVRRMKSVDTVWLQTLASACLGANFALFSHIATCESLHKQRLSAACNCPRLSGGQILYAAELPRMKTTRINNVLLLHTKNTSGIPLPVHL